jgi:hypothetical protein
MGEGVELLPPVVQLLSLLLAPVELVLVEGLLLLVEVEGHGAGILPRGLGGDIERKALESCRQRQAPKGATLLRGAPGEPPPAARRQVLPRGFQDRPSQE